MQAMQKEICALGMAISLNSPAMAACIMKRVIAGARTPQMRDIVRQQLVRLGLLGRVTVVTRQSPICKSCPEATYGCVTACVAGCSAREQAWSHTIADRPAVPSTLCLALLST